MAINQLKAGALLSYLSIALNNIVGLLYTPYMLRMLGQSEYGLYSLVVSVVAYLTVLDLGFGNAIVRYTAKYRAEGRQSEQYEMFGMFLILYSVVGVIALGGGLLLYNNIESLFGATMTLEEISKARTMMLLLTFNLAFTFPMSLFHSLITAYERFVFQKVVNLIRIILNPIVMVVLLYYGHKAITMVVVTTLFNVFSLCMDAWYCFARLHIQIRFARFKRDFLREVSIYSFWIFLNAIMDRIYWSTGQFVLGAYRGATSVAIYAVAIQLQNIYMAFSGAIAGVFLPKVTAMVTRSGSEKEVSNLFIRTGRMQYIVMVFILTGFILFGRSFILLWAGDDYAESYPITLLFFVALIIPLIQNLGITILQARNQMKFYSTLYLTSALISLGIAIPFVQWWGGLGYAAALSFALIFGQVVVMNIYYHRCVSIDIIAFWREIARMSVVPLVMGVSGYFILQGVAITTFSQLLQGIALFSVLYIPLFWFLSMNQEERELLGKPINKLIHKLR